MKINARDSLVAVESFPRAERVGIGEEFRTGRRRQVDLADALQLFGHEAELAAAAGRELGRTEFRRTRRRRSVGRAGAGGRRRSGAAAAVAARARRTGRAARTARQSVLLQTDAQVFAAVQPVDAAARRSRRRRAERRRRRRRNQTVIPRKLFCQFDQQMHWMRGNWEITCGRMPIFRLAE